MRSVLLHEVRQAHELSQTGHGRERIVFHIADEPNGGYSLSMVEKQKLTFAVLSDVGNHVACQFGLVFTINEAVHTAHRRIDTNLPAFGRDLSGRLVGDYSPRLCRSRLLTPP